MQILQFYFAVLCLRRLGQRSMASYQQSHIDVKLNYDRKASKLSSLASASEPFAEFNVEDAKVVSVTPVIDPK